MRAIFGVLSLLIVLAVVGSLAKTQLQALGVVGSSARDKAAASAAQITPGGPGSRDGSTISVPASLPGAMAGDINALTVPQQSKALQDKVRDDTARAMQQSADRTKQRADQN